MREKGKTENELYDELKELQQRYDSLKTSYEKIIDSQKEEEEVIHENESSRFRKIIEQAPIAMAVVAMDGVIEFINHKAISVFGYQPEEIPDMERWWTLAYPDKIYRDEVVADWTGRIEAAIQESREIIGNEYRVTCKDESLKTVFISGAYVSNKIFVMFDDITERKQVEEALRESEERFSKAYMTSPIAFMIARMEDGQIFEVNDAFTAVSGFSREEALSSSTLSLKMWVEEHDRQKMIATLKKGQALIRQETRLRAKEGSVITTLLSAQVIQLGHKHYIISSIEDISERKKAEEALRRSEERYRALIDFAVDGILLCSAEGIIMDANEQICSMLGMKRHGMIGLHLSRLPYTTESIEKAPFRFDLLEKGETVVSERIITRPDGSQVAIEMHSKIMPDGTYQSIFRDISERKRAVEALTLSEDKFRKAFLTNPDSININRMNDGLFVSINKGFTQLIGYTEEETIGKTSLELNVWHNPEDRKKLIYGLQTQGHVENLEAKFCMKNGTIKDGLMSAAIIDLEGVPHIISITRDISSRKQMEEELIRAKEKAEESDRLKTAFLQNMSHEIRTPMNAIMGFSTLLIDEYNNKRKLEHYSAIINQRCNDLLEIINDILDIAKIESGQLPVTMEECDLVTLFEELTSFFIEYQNRLGKEAISFSLLADCSPSGNIIVTDKVKLKQIFINLVSNAFKYTDEGRIEGGCRYNEKDQLVFFVKDTGIGIPLDKQEIVFERFTQLNQVSRKNAGGTGLGLSIVKGLVGILGGEIYLESEPGRGSLFTFTIPYEKSLAGRSGQLETGAASRGSISGKTLLIVEDDMYNTEYLKEILSTTGLQILETDNGREAIELAISRPVDLVLMDIRLPDIDGYKAAKQIRQHKPGLKIIAQTAYASHDERQKALDAGCVDYISKPTRKDLMLSMVNKHVSG